VSKKSKNLNKELSVKLIMDTLEFLNENIDDGESLALVNNIVLNGYLSAMFAILKYTSEVNDKAKEKTNLLIEAFIKALHNLNEFVSKH
jgi:hypothetical protein